MSLDHPYIDVSKIQLAHENTLDQTRKYKCPQGRDSYGLVYVLDGEAEYRFNSGERIKLIAQDIAFMSPKAAYTIVTSKPFRHYTVNFNVCEKNTVFGALKDPFYLLRNENTRAFEGMFKKLVNTWTQKTFGYEMHSMSILYELLFLLYFNCLNFTDNRSKQRLQKAKEYIEQNFHQPICLEQLAYLSNMSVSNFRREWSKFYTESPIAYRDSMRLNFAKDYLSCGYYTVAEVAKKCGFEDASYFVRFFKKKTGCTPNEFKKQLLE